MKKAVLVLSLSLSSLALFSQESSFKERYQTNKLWDNWFVNFGGGGSMYFGDIQHDEATLSERLTWGASASVGKWFSPIVGARLTFQGGQKHTFNQNGIPMLDKNGKPIPNTLSEENIHHMASGNYISAHADAMLNLSNLVAGYKPNRMYNLIPYMGLGIATDNKKFKNKSAVAAVGFLNSFRITDGFAITLDISGQAVQSKFDDARFPKGTRSYDRQDWDGIGSVMLGFTFGLGGKQKFEKASIAPKIIDNTDTSLVADLNGQINELLVENENLKKQLKNKPKETPAPTPAPASTIVLNVPNPVQFEINSSAIDGKQEAVIYNVAQFLKKNTNTSVQIVGLADKKTGSPAYNKALSQKRAKAVENKLVKEYGISKNRISSSWKGDKEQPYPTNDWNRVVVITVTE